MHMGANYQQQKFGVLQLIQSIQFDFHTFSPIQQFINCTAHGHRKCVCVLCELHTCVDVLLIKPIDWELVRYILTSLFTRSQFERYLFINKLMRAPYKIVKWMPRPWLYVVCTLFRRKKKKWKKIKRDERLQLIQKIHSAKQSVLIVAFTWIDTKISFLQFHSVPIGKKK